MNDPGPEREAEQLRRLRKIMPWLALGMSVVTFFIIKAAGHPVNTSLFVAGAMFVFVFGTFKMRELFGVQGFIVALLALSALGVVGQRLGWF